MDPKDAIFKALTPGSLFNQQGKVWRSLSTLAQFSNLPPLEVLEILEHHFGGLVTLRPSRKRPQHGPLVALSAIVEENDPDGPIKIAGGPVFAVQAEEPDVDENQDQMILEKLNALNDEEAEKVPEF